MARDLADSMGCDPLEFMMRIVNSDTIEQTVIAPDGKKQHIEVAIPLDTRMDAAKAVANYLYPKLNATAVTGANDRPVLMASENLSVLMSSSEAVELAQRLALLMAESTPARIISPDEIQTPAPS
jgi:hypothetical protein